MMKINYWIAIAATVLIVSPAAGVRAAVVTENIAYKHGGENLEGFLAYDDEVKGKRPAVLIVHEWWGLTEYVRNRARQLAGLGYVAFALDMYGKGRVTEHPDKASEWMKQVSRDVSFWRERAAAGLAVLRQQVQTDPRRLAAIGYCFGGATVQQLAYSGADLRGVVSFHGHPTTPEEDAAVRVKAAILICHGAADPFIGPDKIQAYLTAMESVKLRYTLIAYSGAKHGFTNPDADEKGMAALAYNPSADRRSWEHMKIFFGEIFR